MPNPQQNNRKNHGIPKSKINRPMSFHRSILVLRARHGGGPIELAYQHRVSAGTIRSDANQLSLSRALDSLYSSLNKGVAIADEDVDIAARYYDANDSSKSRWKSLLSSLASTGRRGDCSNVGDDGESAGVGSSNFVGVANAALHSFWNSTTMRTNNNLLHSGGWLGNLYPRLGGYREIHADGFILFRLCRWIDIANAKRHKRRK